MANLIDGVIAAGSKVGTQCLQAVTDLTGIATSAGGTAFSTAGDLFTWAKGSGNLSATPALGDIAVYGANMGGAGSAGHAGIVTAVNGSTVAVTSTNWNTESSGETQNIVGAGGGQPSGYINPTVLGGKNIITGATAQTATLTSFTGDLNSGAEAVLPGLSGAENAVSAAEKAASAVTTIEQDIASVYTKITNVQTWWRVALVGGAFLAFALGIGLLTRRQLTAVVNAPVDSIGQAATAITPSPSSVASTPAPRPTSSDFTRSNVVARSKARGSSFLTGE